MDLHNLVTVEYSVSYNQTKLQTVIKELQNRITLFDSSIKNIDTKCKQIQESENNVLSRIQKFQKFTIDNLRQTVGQVSTLKMGLRNFLGDQWVKEQEKVQILPKNSNYNKILESKLSAFNSEAKQLSKRVSQLKVQLTTKTSHHQEQTQDVKQTIMNQKREINKIRESIRQGINEKFSHYRKQFQEKNFKEIYKKVQMASDASLKSMEEMDEKNAKAIEKALKQYKRVSITSNIESTGNLPIGKPETLNHLESCGNLLMGGQDDNGLQDVIDFQSDIRNRKKGFWGDENQLGEFQNNDIHQTRISAGLGFLQHMQMANPAQNHKVTPNRPPNENLIEAKSMEHAINQLREELLGLIKTETMEFKSSIEALTANSEKSDSSISALTKETIDLKKDFTQSESKISDIRNDIQNIKNSVYENNEKQNQSLGRIIETESKIDQLQAQTKSLSKQLQVFSYQEQEGDQSSRFKDIKNVSRGPSERNSILRTSLYKSSMNSSGLNNENIIISRLNLLNQKMVKMQEKLKNGTVGSDKNLPKIGSFTNITTKNITNSPSVDLLRKDLQNTNEELNKTNDRLETMKKNLKELQASQNLIPNRISKLETQVTQINQIQQDRLLQLIKELINRVLTDPFNNHFTNTLKRQIHVKFLEIKHEYSSIWKDIEAKVTDRAETAELEKLKVNLQTQNIEIKALINKKTDTDDFKKGIKYIDTKLKEVYTYLKGKQDLDNSPQGRKYYMGKKA